jgi:hypothetical protein
MSNQKQGMFMPALVGGAIAGVLSGIPLLNCLCCLWIIGGAMLASYLLAKDSPVSLTAGDGAIVGIFTGIIAAIVRAILSIPLHAVEAQFARSLMQRLSQYAEEMPSGWQSWLDRGTAGASVSWLLFGLVISAAIFSALGALGGVIGASVFRKKKPAEPAQPGSQGMADAPQDSSHRQP